MKKKIIPSQNFKVWGLGIVVILLSVAIFGKMNSGVGENHYCQKKHNPTTLKPNKTDSAQSWLTMGDYDYESGNCLQAVEDLNKAIALNPKYAEAYNNRGFIKAKLQQYGSALLDYNEALKFRPDYPHALMNRGDLYYRYKNDKTKALADYDKVIVMGKTAIKSEAVCGRRLMVLYDGNWFRAMRDIVTQHDDTGCLKLYFEK